MKLLVLSNEFPPGPGGIGTHAHQVASELHRAGWTVTVVTNQDYVDPGEAQRFRDASPLPIVGIRRRRIPGLGSVDRLRAWWAARGDGPDVVLATGVTSVWMAALGRRRAPWVAIGHGTEFVARQRWRRALNRWAFGRADAVVCVSAFTAARLVEAGIRPRRLLIIPNGADDAHFGPDPDAGKRFRAERGLEDVPVVLTVGNVSERKGQDVVVRTLAAGRGPLARAHYVIAGLPTRAREIRRLAADLGVADRVHLLGRIPPQELAAAYNAADVFAMTSRRVPTGDVEGYGIAVVEAALCAKPAVVTSDSGLTEAVIHDETGLVVPQDDVAATTDALQCLLSDAAGRRRQGERARARALAELTWSALAERYGQHLEQVAAPDDRRTLTLVSDTPHHLEGDRLVGWGPNVREIDHLATLFDEVRHVAPLYRGPAPRSALAHRNAAVVLRPVVPAGGSTLRAKLGVLARYPGWGRAIRREVAGADLVHVRCPSNISLLALGLLRRRPPARTWLKYGGNWHPDGAEPWTYRLQRRVLRRGLPGAAVTVNGEWPDQPPHVRAFRNPTLTAEELLRGRQAATKQLDSSVRLLFVGRLDRAKGANRCLEVLRGLRDRGREVHLDVAGDGSQWAAMHEEVARLGLESCVTFHGWLPRAEVEPLYAAGHLLLLPTDSEGFPKVISEAMAFGVVPLAGAVSSIPQALAELGTGRALTPGDTAAWVDAVEAYIEEPAAWSEASRRGVEGAEIFAYEGYLQEVAALVGDTWDLDLAPRPPEPVRS